MSELKDRLKRARKLRGMTQAELAAKSGCSQSAIGNVESGTRDSLGNLIEVARALDVSPFWLYDGNGPAPQPTMAEPNGTYTVPRWLFSAELFAALADKDSPTLERVENIVRAHLDLPPRSAKEARHAA